MQVYAQRMFNFMRFGEADNSLVYDLSIEQKEMLRSGNTTMDLLYDEIKKDPCKHVNLVKERGIENLIGIVGKIDNNTDESCGAGKSAIFEAICYAHYDKIVRRLANTEKDGKAGLSVVTKLNKKYPANMRESWVEEIFEESGKIYMIKRGRSFSKTHKSHSPILEFKCFNEDSTSDSEMGHRSGDTGSNIDSVNMLDYDMFVNSQMFGQNDAGKFLNGSDKTKKEMIISLLSLETVVDGCLMETRDRKNKQDKKVQQLRYSSDRMCESAIKSYAEWADSSSKEIVFGDEFVKLCVTNILARIEQHKDKVKVIEKSVKDIEESINILEKSGEMETLRLIEEEGRIISGEKKSKDKMIVDQTKQWEDLISSTNSSIVSKQASKKQIESKIDMYGLKIKAFNDTISSFDKAKHEDLIAKAIKSNEKKPLFDTKYKELNGERDVLLSEINISKHNIQSNKSIISNLEKNIRDANGKDIFVCGSCNSEVTIEHVVNEIKKFKDLNLASQAIVDEKTKKLSELEINIKDIKSKIDKMNEYIFGEASAHSKIKVFEDSKVRLEEMNKEIVSFNDAIATIVTEISNMNVKCDEYKVKKNDIKSSFDEDLKTINKKLETLREKYKSAKENSDVIAVRIDVLKKEKELDLSFKSIAEKSIGSLSKDVENIEKNKSDIDCLRVQIEEESKILNRLLIIEDVYGLDGVQTRIIGKYLPMLNMYIKEYIDILTNGKMGVTVYINDRQEIAIYIVGGTAETYDMLSGGEKMLVRLSVNIGLSLLSFSRLLRKPEMICLDEIFGPLDNKHKETIFKLLKKLNGIFGRIVIISHKMDVNKVIKTNVVVEKEGGIYGLSKIKILGENVYG